MAKRSKRGPRKKRKPTAPPDDPAALFRHASTLHERGALDEAEAMCRRVLATTPDHAWALNLMGVIHCQTKRADDGIKFIATALSHAPNEASFFNNLGTGLTGLGRHGDAVTAFSRAIELDPAYATAHNNIGAPLKALGQLADAAGHYRESVRIKPDYGAAWANLANVELDLGNIDAAEAAARESVRLAPDYPAARNNLGTIEHRRGHYGDAEACFRRALELQPQYPDALGNLGEILKETGRATDAMDAYEQAWRLAPGEPEKGSNLLLALCGLDDAKPADIAAKHKQWATNLPAAAPTAFEKTTRARLRVGYVSGDFRRHSVAYFLEPILAHHDHQAFEIFAYANMADGSGDAVTERLKGHVGHWRDVLGLDDTQLAEQVRADGIDILVDLAGHTRSNRLGTFALRPAPVQISYLGYPATTGLSQMDLRLTDPWADPPGLTESFHSEALLRLEGGFLCYRPPEDAPEVSTPPYAENGYVTFGSFNNLAKLSPTTIKLWSEILLAVPDAKLRLKAKALGDEGTRLSIIQRFSEAGIAEDRLELMAWITSASPLAAYHGVDIGLDTFPYHGTTTTLEALWMGVPVVTLADEWHASRVGVSILARAKADDLIAANGNDYVEIAASLAGKPDVMAEYRRHLRGMLVRGGLTDGAAFTAQLEQTYRDAYRQLFS